MNKLTITNPDSTRSKCSNQPYLDIGKVFNQDELASLLGVANLSSND
jgi:hypothetical protein